MDALRIEESHFNRFREGLKTLWSESGNAIAHLYAGTGALESGSRIQDAQRSISRTIKNNTSDGMNLFSDLGLTFRILGEKQKLIDRLLYGNLPETLHGQKTLALIGNCAVGLSPQTRENIYFRKGEVAADIPIRVRTFAKYIIRD